MVWTEVQSVPYFYPLVWTAVQSATSIYPSVWTEVQSVTYLSYFYPSVWTPVQCAEWNFYLSDYNPCSQPADTKTFFDNIFCLNPFILNKFVDDYVNMY